jgi:hypothetical protein
VREKSIAPKSQQAQEKRAESHFPSGTIAVCPKGVCVCVCVCVCWCVGASVVSIPALIRRRLTKPYHRRTKKRNTRERQSHPPCILMKVSQFRYSPPGLTMTAQYPLRENPAIRITGVFSIPQIRSDSGRKHTHTHTHTHTHAHTARETHNQLDRSHGKSNPYPTLTLVFDARKHGNGSAHPLHID